MFSLVTERQLGAETTGYLEADRTSHIDSDPDPTLLSTGILQLHFVKNDPNLQSCQYTEAQYLVNKKMSKCDPKIVPSIKIKIAK
jgi:hypothetical protein